MGRPPTASRLCCAREEMGLTHISLTMYNLPRELPARLDYLERVAEEILRKVA